MWLKSMPKLAWLHPAPQSASMPHKIASTCSTVCIACQAQQREKSSMSGIPQRNLTVSARTGKTKSSWAPGSSSLVSLSTLSLLTLGSASSSSIIFAAAGLPVLHLALGPLLSQLLLHHHSDEPCMVSACAAVAERMTAQSVFHWIRYRTRSVLGWLSGSVTSTLAKRRELWLYLRCSNKPNPGQTWLLQSCTVEE